MRVQQGAQEPGLGADEFAEGLGGDCFGGVRGRCGVGRAARRGCGDRSRSAGGRTSPFGTRRAGPRWPVWGSRPGRRARSRCRGERRPPWRRASAGPAAQRAGWSPRSWRRRGRCGPADSAWISAVCWLDRLETAEPVAVGAEVVGQLEAVTGVGLGSGGPPAGPGGMERVRVDRHHRMPGGQQPVDHQTRRSLRSPPADRRDRRDRPGGPASTRIPVRRGPAPNDRPSPLGHP